MSTLRVIALTAILAPAFSATAVAGDDPRYPAYDFQPTIIQKATDTGSSSAGSHASSAASSQEDKAYPGAYFTPKVIYLDPALAK